MKNNNLSRLCLLLVIIGLPFFAYVEHKQNSIWAKRLAIPQLVREPSFHTPRYSEGTYLPIIINKDVTIAPEDGPVLIAGVVTITPQGSLLIQAGTNVYVHEYGQIVNQGNIVIEGTKDAPVIFDTNETNEANQVWGGIIVSSSGKAIITNTIFTHASPAVSCLTGSHVSINNSTIRNANVGLYSETSSCILQNSRITAVRDAIVAVHQKPITQNVAITANHSDLNFIP